MTMTSGPMSFEIERIEEMRLALADDAAIAALLASAFQGQDGEDPDGGFGGRSFYQQRHHVRFVARDGGRIFGHLALCLRSIRMGDRLVQIAGVADVATDLAARGQGVASALLRASIDEARASPAEAMMLFGVKTLYAGHGFAAKGNVLRYLALHDARTGDVRVEAYEGLMVLPFGDFVWDDDAEVDLVGPAF